MAHMSVKVLDLVLHSEKLLRISRSLFKQPAGTTEVSEHLPRQKAKENRHGASQGKKVKKST